MKGSSFITIGIKDAEDNDCVRLSDLKVSGVDPEVGCWNSVKIIYLNKDGSNRLYEDGPLAGIEMKFQWTDDGHDGEWGGAPGWYGVDGLPMDGSSAAGLASDITFAVGEGICFEVDMGYENCQLLCNGQVVTGQVEFKFNSDANVFVSNPLARTITLDELTIGGVDPEVGCWNSVKVIYLNKDGSNTLYEDGELAGIEMKFQWTDDGHDGEWGGLPGWYGVDGLPMDGSSAAGLASEVEFPLGQGIYFEVDMGYENCFVKFPSLGLKQ